MFESQGKHEPKLVYAHKRSDSQREDVTKTPSVILNGSAKQSLNTNPTSQPTPVEAAPTTYKARLQNSQVAKQQEYPQQQMQQKQQHEYKQQQQQLQQKQQEEYQQQQAQQKQQQYTQRQADNVAQSTKQLQQPPSTPTALKQQISGNDLTSKQHSMTEIKLPLTLKPTPVQTTEKVTVELKKNKAPQTSILDDNNNKEEKFEGFKIYRGKNYDTKNEPQSIEENVIRQSPPVPSGPVVDKGKYEYSQHLSSGQKAVVIQNNDLKTTSGVRYSSKTIVSNGPASPGFKQQHYQQNLSNEFQHHQRQQHHIQQQHQQGQPHANFKDSYRHVQESRMQPFHHVIQNGGGPPRQHTAKNIRLTGPTIGEANHVGNRPRASSAKLRPQPQTYVTAYQNPREQVVSWPQEDYYGHNRGRDPTSSPRSNGFHPRSSYRLDPGMLVPQATSANPPKSILKNNVSLEQSDLYLSARPLVLPRPRSHSHRGPSTTYLHPDFDFSTILTANKDPLESKQRPHIVVKGQVKNAYVPPMASATNPKRPVSAGGTALHRYELSNDNQPQRKSVTFNSKVRLHIDNQSTVRSLAVDAQ